MGHEREPLPHDEAIRALHQAADTDAAGKADSRRLRALAKLLAAGPTSLATLMEDLFPDDDSGSKFRAFLSRVNGALEAQDLELASAPRGNAPATEKTLQVLARPDLVRRALRADAPPGLPPGPEYRDELFVPMRVLRAPSCGDRNAVSAALAKDPSWLALSDADRETMSQLGVQFSAVEDVPSGKVCGLRIARLGPTGEDWGSFCATSIGVQHREMVNVVATLHALVVASHALSAMAEAADIQANVFVPLDASLILDRRIADVLHRRPPLNDRVIFEVEGDHDDLAKLSVRLAAEPRRLAVPLGPDVDQRAFRRHIHSRIVRADQLLKLSGQTLDVDGVAGALRDELSGVTKVLVEQITEDFAQWPSMIAAGLPGVDVLTNGPAVGLPPEFERWFEPVSGSESRFVLRDPARRQDQALLTGVRHLLDRYRCESRWETDTVVRFAVPVEDFSPGRGAVDNRVGVVVLGALEPMPADVDFVVTQTPRGPRQGDLQSFEQWLRGCFRLSDLARALPEADHPTREGDVPLYKQNLFEPPRARVQDRESDALDWLIAWSNEPNAPLTVVLGEYGMGKTFIARAFARELFKRAKRGMAIRLPVYVDLRRCDTKVDGRVPTLSQLLTRVLESDTEEVLHLVSTGRALLILDGFDEKAVHLSRHEAWQLLDAVRDFVGRAAEKGQQPKVLLTSRDHLFRSRREEEGLLAGSHRDGGEVSGWRFCHLLPMDEERVRGALVRLLGDAEADRVGAVIRGRADLVDLASRPFLLRLIARHADRLMSHLGPLNATTLFDLTVYAWLQRDEGKHGPQEQTKLRWMEDLALRMHVDGSTQTGLAPAEVEAWVVGRGEVTASGTMDAFGNDPERNIRVAAFIVKGPDDQWKFAHRSFGEHFLARALARGLAREGVNALDVPALPQEVLQHLVERLVADRTAGSPASRGWERKLEAVRQTRAPVAAAEHLFGLVMWWRRLKQADPPSLRGAKLGPVYLAAQDLEDLDLSGSDLSGADLSLSRAERANLRGARLAEAVLFEARWTRVDLGGADLRGACADRAVLDACDVDRVDVSGASLVGARLLDLRGVWTAGGADLTASVVVGANPGGEGAKTGRQMAATKQPSWGVLWSPALSWELQAEEAHGARWAAAGAAMETTSGGGLRFMDAERGVPLRTNWFRGLDCLAAHRSSSDREWSVLFDDGSIRRLDANGQITGHCIAEAPWEPAVSAFSADGSLLVSMELGKLTIRSATTLRVLSSRVHSAGARYLSWCGGDDAVCFVRRKSGARHDEIGIWRWREEVEVVHDIEAVERPVSVSPDGNAVVALGQKGGVYIDVVSLALVSLCGGSLINGHVAWSPNGCRFAVVGDGFLRIFHGTSASLEFEERWNYLGSADWLHDRKVSVYPRLGPAVWFELGQSGVWSKGERASHVRLPSERSRGFELAWCPQALIASHASNRLWWSTRGSLTHTAERGVDVEVRGKWASRITWGRDSVLVVESGEMACFSRRTAELMWTYRPGAGTCPSPGFWIGERVYWADNAGFSTLDLTSGEELGRAELPLAAPNHLDAVDADQYGVLLDAGAQGAWRVRLGRAEKLESWSLAGWQLVEFLPDSNGVLVRSADRAGLLDPVTGQVELLLDSVGERSHEAWWTQERWWTVLDSPYEVLLLQPASGEWRAKSRTTEEVGGHLPVRAPIVQAFVRTKCPWLVVDTSGRLIEWDIHAGLEPRIVTSDLGPIACSQTRCGSLWLGRPDGRLFAVDPSTGDVVDELPVLPCGVTRIAPVGEQGLAAVYADGTLRIWDLETRTLRWGALTFSNGKVAVFDANDDLIGGSEGVEAQLYVSDGREALELSTWKRGLAYGWRIMGES